MNLWILIADEGRARAFTAVDRRGPLVEVEGFVHSKSRMKDREFLTDRPGRVRSGPTGQAVAALPPHTDPKEIEADQFAAELARMLSHARTHGKFSQLAIVAAPGFLGRLRNHLDDACASCLVACEPKDLTLLPARELIVHLSTVLEAASRAATAQAGHR